MLNHITLDDATRRKQCRSFYNLRYTQAICPRYHKTRPTLTQRNNIWNRWDRRIGNGVYHDATGVCAIFDSPLSFHHLHLFSASSRPVCKLWELENNITIRSIVLTGFSPKKGSYGFGLAPLLDLPGWWCVFMTTLFCYRF